MNCIEDVCHCILNIKALGCKTEVLLGHGTLKGHHHAIVASLQKAKTCLRINFFLFLYISTLSIYCCLLKQVARMGMNRNLKTLANFLKFSSCVLNKFANKLLWFGLATKFHLIMISS